MAVLVVDDNDANVSLLKGVMNAEGLFRITTVTDPRLVERLLAEVKPDLVLLDLHMPYMNGLDILRIISRYADGTYLPVLILTADTTTEARDRALEQGARDFLTKPFDIVEAVLRIANLLETRQLHMLLRPKSDGDIPLQRAVSEVDEGASNLDRIETVLRDESIVPYYQPVVDISSRKVVGQEALARFPMAHLKGPAGWFADAFAAGLGTELEWLAVKNALPYLDTADPASFLAINMSPASVQLIPERQEFHPALCPQIVIELTEHVPIEDYSAIHSALRSIRDHGARLAADDLGSGYAGFRHLVALQPDIVKLDISLIRGIHRSRPQRALARALVAFASDVQATVIAEGVEDADELAVLQDMGVTWAQGYYLGRPAPVPVGASRGGAAAL